MNQIQIKLPKLGESVADATLTNWCVNVGDIVQKDDILCEIGTDKVETELPSEYAGKIEKLLCQEGDTIEVGKPIIILSTEEEILLDETTIEVENIPEPSSREREQPKNTIDKQGFGYLSPVVRQLIEKNDLSLQDVQRISGSGHQQRVTKKDILQFLKQKELKLTEKRVHNLSLSEKDEVIELSRTRQIVAKNMLESYQWIPHVTTFAEIDVTQLIMKRNSLKNSFQDEHGEKITLTHLMMQATVDALKQFPRLNAWLSENQYILKKDINLAFAVAIDDERLIVPNVKQAQDLSLGKLVKNVNELSRKAMEGKIKMTDIEESTFTVSNTGIFGSMMGTPIVSKPQVAVLAFGNIVRKPVVRNISGEERIEPASMMNVSISYDHRVIDGKLASQFLVTLKQILESN